MKNQESDLFQLPSVEHLLQTKKAAELISEFGRDLLVDAIRLELHDIRLRMKKGETVPEPNQILENSRERMAKWVGFTLVPVINASGVILHTNLGRAPISAKAQKAIELINANFNSLEFDLEKGKRGSRTDHLEKFITRLTGAEAAFVVCNNAAAVLLCLSALGRRKRVIVSRSQMVEIGGGFRVPEVMNQSGAKLVEIGTTNKVHLEDYRCALEQPAAIVMRVHHSNFKMTGFTSEPPLKDLVQVSHEHQAYLIDDLGSGALLDTSRFGLAHEPMVQESIAAGADLVCFSGDKLVGGPQAGIIIGRKDLITKLKKHPLARAVRLDKMCLAGLAETFAQYLKNEAEREIPVWQMISKSPEQIKARANHWKNEIGRGDVVAGESTVGGGTLPEETLPTWLLCLSVPQPDRFLKDLRRCNPPIIARIENEKVLFDPRTVFPEQEGSFLVGLKNILHILE